MKKLKQKVSLHLDADVVRWLKESGPGYHDKANGLLRTEMLRLNKPKAKRKGTLADFLLASPLRGTGIEVKRLSGHLRKVDL